MSGAVIENDRDTQARELARKHYEVEAGLKDVILYTENFSAVVQDTQNSIKLLEVNENTIASGIMPIQFAPSPQLGITYPTTIIEVTPEEFEQIKVGKLKLPPGWESHVSIPRPST
jgi:hypothetical protein